MRPIRLRDGHPDGGDGRKKRSVTRLAGLLDIRKQVDGAGIDVACRNRGVLI